ncbi:hypothetical protein SEA_CEN1621_71 [Microbacterium phage Cen1621]|uniref:Uncharacterized protein n=1 Tax=Microbacterium phage Cen1621 TaxID=2965191 RepID=A0A9E7QB45_9CAUD|nr:hypothetical protein SEA_CEN1621_71 [Microbacterium phage Cen1621]
MTDTTFSPMPVADLGAQNLGALSPAAILRYGEEDRIAIAAGREVLYQAAEERVEELMLKLENAKREALLAREALDVAQAIASPEEDTRHERRVGDVIVDKAMGVEWLVLGIRAERSFSAPQYLVIRYRVRDERVGDARPAEWIRADHFNLP